MAPGSGEWYPVNFSSWFIPNFEIGFFLDGKVNNMGAYYWRTEHQRVSTVNLLRYHGIIKCSYVAPRYCYTILREIVFLQVQHSYQQIILQLHVTRPSHPMIDSPTIIEKLVFVGNDERWPSSGVCVVSSLVALQCWHSSRHNEGTTLGQMG